MIRLREQLGQYSLLGNRRWPCGQNRKIKGWRERDRLDRKKGGPLRSAIEQGTRLAIKYADENIGDFGHAFAKDHFPTIRAVREAGCLED